MIMVYRRHCQGKQEVNRWGWASKSGAMWEHGMVIEVMW